MKQHIRKILKYLLVGLIVVACIYVLRPGFIKQREHRDEVKRLEAEIRTLEAERTALEEEMHVLQEENPEQIEKLAREKLHLSKPGETVFRFKKEQ